MIKGCFKKVLSLSLSLILGLCLVLPCTETVHAKEIGLGMDTISSLTWAKDQYDIVRWSVPYSGGSLSEDVVIPEGVTLTITFNGNMLNLNGYHFINYGTLYIWKGSYDEPKYHYVYRNNSTGEFQTEHYILGYTSYCFTNGTIYGGKAENGGFVENYGTCEINDVTIALCETTEGGGAVYNAEGAETLIYGVRFYANKSNTNGGCIYNLGELGINDPLKGTSYSRTSFECNEAWNGFGGAIYNASEEDLTFTGADFNSNKAKSGGAIYTGNGEITLFDDKFNGNEVDECGGAIYIDARGSVEFSDEVTFELNGQEVFEDNKAKLDGGAIYNLGELETFCTEIKNNTANQNGGAIFNGSTGTWTLSDGGTFTDPQKCVITGNTAGVNGGAVYNIGVMDCEDDSPNTFESNQAGENGGAIYSVGETTLGGSPLNITSNTAGLNGGGVYFKEGYLILYDDSIEISGNKVGENANNLCVAANQMISCNGFEGHIGVSFETPENGLKFAEDYDPDEGAFISDDETMSISEKKDYAVLKTANGIGSAISGGNLVMIGVALVIIGVVMVVVGKKKKTAGN